MNRPTARYFKPDDFNAVPWLEPLEPGRLYRWEMVPKSGVALVEPLDAAAVTLLEAVDEALQSYAATAVPPNVRAGVFIEMLASALESHGGNELGFQLVIDGQELTVPARPL